MNIEEINRALEPKEPKRPTLSHMYGVMGLSLGKELHDRLKTHAKTKAVPMSKIIKTLVIAYLNEVEGK